MAISAPDSSGQTIYGGRFSTADLPQRDRHEAWLSRSPSPIGRLHETSPQEPFDATIDFVTLGWLRIHFATITGQYFERSQAVARADGFDDLGISVRFRGAARGDMNGASLDGGSGSIVLSDMAQAQRHLSEASSSVYFSLPRALAEQFLPNVDSLHGLTIAPAAAVLLREHLAQIGRNAHLLPADQGARLASTVMDLLAVAVAQARGEGATPGAAVTAATARAKAEIEARLGSATLTVANLCRSLGVSRSALYRLFEAEGGVHAYITRLRLDRAAADLRDPEEPARIADIADRWGFCDAAYLGRLFRERFGMTPSDYRAFSRRLPSPPSSRFRPAA